MRKQTPTYRGQFELPAFTLIELLVVIATITVLLAILLTALNGTRHVAKRVRCGVNLRQISVAWMGYFNDHEGRLYRDAHANNEYGGWCPSPARSGPRPRPLNRYVGLDPYLLSPNQAGLFHCPADAGGINVFNPSMPVFEDYGTSYQTNNYLIGPPVLATVDADTETLHTALNKRMAGFKVTDVYRPQQVILMGDYPWWNQARAYDTDLDTNWHRKQGSFNISFLDGHVKFQTIIKPSLITDAYTTIPFRDLYSLAREAEEAMRN